MTVYTGRHRNQYLITSAQTQVPVLSAAQAQTIGQWKVYAFPPLSVHHAARDGVEAVLLGVMVDPLRPTLPPAELLEATLDRALELDAAGADIAASTDPLTGRFVIAIAKGAALKIWGDACHLRQIIFGAPDGQRCASSSEPLLLEHLGLTHQMSKAMHDLMSSPMFRRNEHAWVGDAAQDSRLTRLLPNHGLDLASGSVHRRPVMAVPTAKLFEQVIDSVQSCLQGAMAALTGRYKCIQAVTAGMDSRLLLAASLPYKHRIEYFIFDRGDPGTRADSEVAESLSKALDLGLRRIQPEPTSAAFKARMAAEFFYPRDLPKLANVAHHANRQERDTVLSVNGNAAEIGRNYYGLSRHPLTVNEACDLLGYPRRIAYVGESISRWHALAKPAAAAGGIDLGDLLYWEQRMGNWGAMTPRETDLAIEEVSPFNNRNLLLSMLSVPSELRAAPDYPFFRKLITAMSPGAAKIPINPHVAKYGKKLSRYRVLLCLRGRARIWVMSARRRAAQAAPT